MPPDAVTAIEPSLLRLQRGFVGIALKLNAGFSVTVNELVRGHEFASVTVSVYEPAAKPVAVAAL